MPQTPLVRVRDLVVGYGRPLLPAFSLHVEPGQMWAFIGQNGSGKTTILRTLLGLLKPIGGGVSWGVSTEVGYVPQRSTVDQEVPSRVVDLVGQGIDRGRSFLNPFYLRQRRDDIRQAMADCNVTELAHEQFRNLSEGQKQRVLMARALASNPNLMVLDEPTSAMDVVAEETVLDLLDELREKRNLAMMIVSHHLPVVARHATHAILVDKDSGLLETGTIDEIAESEACFERYGNLLLHARKGGPHGK